MSRIPAWFIELAEQPATALLLDVAVKATLLVLLAMLFLRLNPRGSAALRHRVWCLVFCGLVLLPVLCYMLPGLAVPILPARPQEAPQVATSQPVAPSNDLNRVTDSAAPPADPRAVDGMIDSTADKMRAEAMMETIAKDQHPASESATVAHDIAAIPAVPARGEAAESYIAPLPNPSSIWLVGAALALLPLIVGMVRSALLRAKSRNIQDVSWVALRDQLCTRLGLKRAAQLLEVDASIIPLSCGVVRPAVVLPQAARHWNERLRRFVLLHELSHIKRHDVVFQLIARLACALYWFHPLVWYAMHRLRVERELACDDSVLAAGERPSDYAEQLLEVARRLQPVRLHAAVAMAQSNKLEHRVGLLFSRARSHLPLSTWTSRLLLACAAAVVITVSVIRPSARATSEDPPAKEEKQQDSSTAAEPPQRVDDTKPKKITGRVVDPDGTPARGARVLVVRFDNELPGRTINTELLSETITDREGRFSAPAPEKNQRFATAEHFLVSPVYIVVTAPGYGLAWRNAESTAAETEQLLKLVPDDTPIEGRVLDLEGRPLAGVQVAVKSISPSAENIEEWIARARNNPARRDRLSVYYYDTPKEGAPVVAYFPSQGSLELAQPGIINATTTDATGRFRLTGLGSKRLACLELSGSGIAKTLANAVTYAMDSVPYPQYDRRFRIARCFGARFDVTVEPEQRISGVVSDAATGQPLTGIDVRRWQYGEAFGSAVTNAEGKYELKGLARPTESGEKIRLRFVPLPDQPYFRTEINVTAGSALAPIVRNVELKRAIWIRGRVTDEQSGKPVRGMVAYYPFLSNEAAKQYSNVDPGAMGMGDYFHYATDDDGSFRIPGLPGQGILTVVADDDSRYPRAVGADAIGGLRRQNSSEPQKVYYLFTADLVNSVREINPAPGVEEFTCDVKLKPYAPHKVRLLDPAGKPLAGATAEGLLRMPIRGLAPFGSPKSDNVPQSSAIVDVLGLADEQPRCVMFQHRDLRLAAVARFTTADFANDRPKDIVLQPAVAIYGRLVDRHGKPEAGGTAFVRPEINADDDPRGFAQLRNSVGKTTDDAGRFRIDLLPPGVKYSLTAYSRAGQMSEKLEVGPLQPGSEFEIGDISLGADVEQAVAPATAPTSARKSNPPSAAKDAELKQDSKQPSPMPQPAEDNEKTAKATIRGQVLGPDGRPATGAQVLLLRVTRDANSPSRTSEALAEVVTDGDGRFATRYLNERPNPDLYIVAKAPGHGLTWTQVESGGAGKESLIKLAPDDAPIEGRVLNLEGQPIAGVRVTARAVTDSADNIDQWITKAREKPPQDLPIQARSRARFVTFPAQSALGLDDPKLVITATTDTDGRFRLVGLGSKRLARLEISGGGIAKNWIHAVTHLTEPIPYPEPDPRFRIPNCFGARFDVVMEPGLRVTGTLRDATTGQPLRGVEIKVQRIGDVRAVSQSFITNLTDADGHYQLEGIPKLDARNRGVPLYVRPSADQPYFRTHLLVGPTDESDALVHNIELKPAIWIRGRIVDDSTGKPVKGNIAYYPFLTNEAAKEYANFKSELRGMGNDYLATNDDGSFRIPGLAGRGILAAVADDEGKFPLADGADAIGGLHPKNPAQPAVVYSFVTADAVNAVREINPPAGTKEFSFEVRLKPLTPHKVRLLDPDGQPLAGVTVEGLTRRPFPGRLPVGSLDGESVAPSAIVDLYGLSEDQPRFVRFVHHERRLAVIARLSVESFTAGQPKDITLHPAATITGRLVDQNGAAVSGATATTNVVDILNVNRGAPTSGLFGRWTYTWRDQSGPDGRFGFDLVPPNVELRVQGLNPTTRDLVTLEVGPLKPGAQTDVGDMPLAPRSSAKSRQTAGSPTASSNDRSSAKSASNPGDELNQIETAAPSAPKSTDAGANGPPTGSAPQPADKQAQTGMVRGRILGPDGRPAIGAHVAAIARHSAIGRGGELAPDGVVLGEAIADEQGRYQLSIAGASSKTHRYASVIARADNSAVAWQRLDLDASEVNASFNLKPAETITGRLVDIEGQPAEGVRLKIRSIVPTILGFTYPTGGIGFSDSTSLPAAWPQPVETDQQGRFSLLGIPASHGVMLTVEGNDRFAPQELAINTGMSEQRGQRDGTYRPQAVKNTRPGDDVVLTLAPSQIFTGRVTYEDNGEPAPMAHLTIWASQQEHGSMLLVGGRADADGRYRINPHPGIRFGVTAYAPKGAPYLTRQVDQIPWESGQRTKDVNIKLPRGVLVRGQVLEEGSDKPVPGASVQYHPESANNPNDKDDIVTGWQAIEVSDEQGHFEIVVLPGPGRLLVHASGGEFVLKETSSREQYDGRPGGKREYAHGIARIEPATGSEPIDVKFHLTRGGKASGETVDEAGRATGDVLMISRLHIHPFSPYWRGQPQELVGGRFELVGLAPGTEYPVHFLQPTRRLGATVKLKADATRVRVVLEPCGEATMRFVDPDGKPIADHDPSVRFVVTPGPLDWNRGLDESGTLAAEEDFIQNVDRQNHHNLKSNSEGRFKLVALIPGAMYRVLTVRNEKLIVAKEFQAKSRETIDLGDIVFERSEK